MVRESTLYDPMMKFVKRKFECFDIKKQVGITNIGIIDVVGVREIQGDFHSSTEIISVEVKGPKASFLSSIGLSGAS